MLASQKTVPQHAIHLPAPAVSPGVRGSAPAVRPTYAVSSLLCPSPSVAQVRWSRWSQGRPAGRAQRPFTPSAMISYRPTEGVCFSRLPRNCKERLFNFLAHKKGEPPRNENWCSILELVFGIANTL